MMKKNQNLANTLRLGERELNDLLEQYDKEQPSEMNPDREYVRWAFRIGAVDLTIEHSNGSKVTIPVATRNISRGGMSILHASFIHLKTPCEITLSLADGSSHTIPGKIVRCNHLEGRVHEIGIAFNEQFSTKELLGLDPLNEAYSLERVDPENLHGSLLIVTTADLDRDLILMYLEETNLELNTADTVEIAVSRASKGCDIVLAEFHLSDDSGSDLISSLRGAGCDAPVIVMTSDKSDSVLDAIRKSSASGIISKPISKYRLYQALGEFLHADSDGGPLFSTVAREDPAYPLVSKFLADVPRMALDLENAHRENDWSTCLQIVRKLSGAGSPLGFPVISETAVEAEKLLTAGDFGECAPLVRSLIVDCRRIKTKSAA